MNCKKCGYLLTQNDQFCKNCGASVNETNMTDVSMQNVGGYQAPVTNMGNTPMQSVGGYQAPVTNMNMDQNNSQPTWAAGYNTQPTYNQVQQKKSNGNGKFIIIGIVAAVVIIGGIIGLGLIGKAISSSVTGNINTPPTVEQTANKETYKVNYGGFDFKLPVDIMYKESSGQLLLADEEETWIAALQITKGSFNNVKVRKGKLKDLLLQSGYVSSDAQEKNIGGVEFITAEVSQAGTNLIYAIAPVNSTHVVAVVIQTIDNDFDYTLLDKIAPIISSASYSGVTTNMEIGTKLDINKIAELAK